MDLDGYIVSFMPGARGRLISNIVYKLINRVETPIEFTSLNSTHNFIDDINLNYVPDPRTITVSKDKKQVFWTHAYPSDNWQSTLGTIFINCESHSLPEILLNAAIKNIFPKLEKQAAGEELTDTERKFLEAYQKSYPDLNVDLLSDEKVRTKFLIDVVNDRFLHRSLYAKFIGNKTYTGYRIEYESMFNKENGQYTTLIGLAKYLGVEYNQEIHSTYEEYDRDKHNIFVQYCPWFLKEEK